MTGASVTGISMMMVLDTVGVISRRRVDRRRAILNCANEDSMTRVARSAGPPSTSAVIETAMNAPEGPMTSR